MIAGRYSLEREIGRGGMGAVWLGRDEVLGRPVALKRVGLFPGTDGTDLARAEREARLSARLHHPHVVAVFDFVVEEDVQWLVMEYVEGTNLARLIRDRGSLAPDAAAPMLWQVADALVAAHAEGIVHRDVKPSNVLVDASGTAKLSDFGIARVMADPALTQTGLLLGSPTYLAPEVASGRPSDEAADVWSLGATAFHVLAGRPPYENGENVLSTLYRIVNEDPPRPEGAGWIAPMLAGTLVKDPALRWSMARTRDFLARREPVAPSVPASAAASAPAAEATRAMRPLAEQGRRGSRLPVLAGAVVLVLAVAGGLYAGLTSGDHRAASPPAAGSSAPSSPSTTPSSPTSSPKPEPTRAGMRAFIRDYVRAVADDPRTAWTMLTPRFQRASGGFEHYREFWAPARNGRVHGITANPRTMRVSYHVHFDHFHNGPGPTILGLVFDHGEYRIDSEHTKGVESDD